MTRPLLILGLLIAALASQLPLSTPHAAQQAEFVWTLSQTLVNPRNEPTELTGAAVSGRKQGTQVEWTVTETSISHHKHEVDNAYDYYDVTWTADFDRPPTVLKPGDKLELTASVSGSGKVTSKDGSGIAFEYRAEGVLESNLDGETYIAIGMEPFVSHTVTGSFVVPPASPGGEIKIFAFLWNCSACSVHWIYEPEEVPVEADESAETVESIVSDLVDAMLDASGGSAPVVDGNVSADVTRIRILDGVGSKASCGTRP